MNVTQSGRAGRVPADAPKDRSTRIAPSQKDRLDFKTLELLPEGIELSTSPLPRGCSTTELRQRRDDQAARYSPRAGGGASNPLDDAPPSAMVLPMAKDEPARPKSAISRSKQAARRQREAAALRANLRKRKDQARARDKPKQD